MRNKLVEFVMIGYFLMEVVLEIVFLKYDSEIWKGVVLIDLDGWMDGFLWFIMGEVKDGSGEIVGRRLICLY